MFLLLFLLLVCWLAAPEIFAQKWKVPAIAPDAEAAPAAAVASVDSKNPAAPAAANKRISNRFLFIVDTSAGMQRQAAPILDTVNQILTSRAGGQLYRGDTIGIWTFDNDLYTGSFPLQIWSPEEEQAIAARALDFLKKQRHGKLSRLDRVFPSLYDVVRDSGILTVILVSDGESQIQGTPFDREINKAYQQSLRDMAKERMPIVTVLQSKNGKIVQYTVNPLPWPVVVPELPIAIKDESVMAAKAEPAVTPVTNAPAPTAKSPEATPTHVNPPVATATPVPQLVPKPVTPTPELVPPAAPPVVQQTAQPAPPAVIPPPVETARSTTIPAPSTSAPALPPVIVRETPKAETVSRPPPEEQPKARLATNGMRAEGGPSGISAVEPAKSIPENPVKPAPAVQKVDPYTSAKSSNSQAAATPPPQVAMAAPPEVASRPKMLLIAGVTLVFVAILLILLMIRRARGPSGPSLITKSMNLKR